MCTCCATFFDWTVHVNQSKQSIFNGKNRRKDEKKSCPFQSYCLGCAGRFFDNDFLDAFFRYAFSLFVFTHRNFQRWSTQSLRAASFRPLTKCWMKMIPLWFLVSFFNHQLFFSLFATIHDIAFISHAKVHDIILIAWNQITRVHFSPCFFPNLFLSLYFPRSHTFARVGILSLPDCFYRLSYCEPFPYICSVFFSHSFRMEHILTWA